MRYAEGPRVPAGPCAPPHHGQSFLQTSDPAHRGPGPVWFLPADPQRWESHRDQSSLDLSASGLFLKKCPSLLRLPCKIHIISPGQCFQRCPNGLSVSSFPNSSHSYLRSTSYENPILHDTEHGSCSLLDISIYSTVGKPSISGKKTLPWLTDTVSAQLRLKMAHCGLGKSWCHFNCHKRMSHLLSAQVIMYLSWIGNKRLKSLPDSLTLTDLLPTFIKSSIKRI